jgi:hypothetical protein
MAGKTNAISDEHSAGTKAGAWRSGAIPYCTGNLVDLVSGSVRVVG